jgi:hypothetical protein
MPWPSYIKPHIAPDWETYKSWLRGESAGAVLFFHISYTKDGGSYRSKDSIVVRGA